MEDRGLSFVKQMAFGDFASEKVFPYPKPLPEENERLTKLLQELELFANQSIDPEWIDRNSKIPDSVFEGLGRLGIFGLVIPRNYGGLGMSQYALCKVMEVLARRCSSTAAMLTAHLSIGIQPIIQYAKEPLRQQILPLIAQGKCVASFALTEPNAGSDVTAVETRAVYDPVKNVYRINGKKQWITNGSFAKVLTVFTQIEMDGPEGKKDKLAAFLVTPDMPGFKVLEPNLDKLGLRGIQNATLLFENLEVPADNLLGELGEGLKVALGVLNFGRIAVGCSSAAPGKKLVQEASQHAVNRRQFKKTIASFASVKYKLAVMESLVYAMDATTYLVAGLADRGEKDFSAEASILKVFATDAIWKINYETMQIFGGLSVFTRQPYERSMRDSRIGIIVEGSNDVMILAIGYSGIRELVKDYFKNPSKSILSLAKLIRHYFSALFVPTISIQSSILSQEAKEIQKAIRRLHLTILRLIIRYGKSLADQQMMVRLIGKAIVAIYTSVAVISKLDSNLKVGGVDCKKFDYEIEVAKFYCKHAMESLNKRLDRVAKKEDNAYQKIADHMTGYTEKT